MKLVSLMMCLFLASSCGGLPTKIGSPFAKPDAAPTVTPITGPAPAAPLPRHVDDEFQKTLSKIWGNYFIENYSDTRALDVLVVTNRQLNGTAFGCSNDQLGVERDDGVHFGICKINVPKISTSLMIQAS